MESGQRKLAKNPRESANLISIIFFGWSIPILRKIYNVNILHPNDAFEPLDQDRSEVLGNQLEKYVLYRIINKYIVY